MNIRMLSIAFLFVSVPLFAVEVNVHGILGADAVADFDPDFQATYLTNHEVLLTTEFVFDQSSSVEFRLATTSSVLQADSTRGRALPRSGKSVAGDKESRWPALLFDGIAFKWAFAEKGTFILGDMIYSGGPVVFYNYRHPWWNGAIMKQQYIRGAGVEVSGLQVYVGAPDENAENLAAYVAYAVPAISRSKEKLMIKPQIDAILLGGGRTRKWNMGADFEYSRSMGWADLSASGTVGYLPYGKNETWTVLAEPAINLGDFSLGAGYYQAFLADNSTAAEKQTDMPVELFSYVEPGVSLGNKVALGFPVEYHDADLEWKGDERYVFGPVVYLYPSSAMEMNFWVNYRMRETQANNWQTGAEALVNF